MRRRLVIIAILLVACAHGSVAPSHPISVREILATPTEFGQREITVAGYWIQTGISALIIDTSCPVQSGAIQVVLSPGALRNSSAVKTIRFMTRRSGVRFEPHVSVTTIDSKVAEFLGKGTFEYSVCPSEPSSGTPDYEVMDAVKSDCIAYRLTVKEITRLHRVSLDALPACFRGEPDEK
jgi:hypothetical protein